MKELFNQSMFGSILKVEEWFKKDMFGPWSKFFKDVIGMTDNVAGILSGIFSWICLLSMLVGSVILIWDGVMWLIHRNEENPSKKEAYTKTFKKLLWIGIIMLSSTLVVTIALAIASFVHSNGVSS